MKLTKYQREQMVNEVAAIDRRAASGHVSERVMDTHFEAWKRLEVSRRKSLVDALRLNGYDFNGNKITTSQKRWPRR